MGDIVVPTRRPWPGRLPLYYGWVNLVLAAAAMTATLPGRTFGLGLITGPLTADPALGVNESAFGVMNFWAVTAGAACCLPVGRLIDRFGTRVVLAWVVAGLGAGVLGMSLAGDALTLFVSLFVVRWLGQGALSVVSLAMVGKWFVRRLGIAMGLFSLLLGVGFMTVIPVTGAAVIAAGWRSAWAGVGGVLLGVWLPLGWLGVRSTPEAIGVPADAPADAPGPGGPLDVPVLAAVVSPGFWVMTLGPSFYNLISSAITLFNESLMAERGFTPAAAQTVLIGMAVTGLPTNLLAGWVAGRWPLGRLLAVGMTVLAATLALYPFVGTTAGLCLYAAGLGVSGGIVTVVFFAVYGQAYGRANLGSIQTVAQVVTVLASASGPVLLTWLRDRTGSSVPLFVGSAGVAVLLGAAAWPVRLPGPGGTSPPARIMRTPPNAERPHP